ncbi:MAG: adenine phosphoribosyltransferase [Candidatus Micrarchaeia archaeon]
MGIEDIVVAKIRNIKDYPKKGIVFRDITPLLKDPDAFSMCINHLSKEVEKLPDWKKINYLAAVEARGFIVGSALAYKMGIGLIPVRKPGKLPYEKESVKYRLEYSSGRLEMHKDALSKGDRVLIVDDLLATGGTSLAARDLVQRLGGTVSGFAYLIELKGMEGRKNLSGYKVISLAKL